MYQSLFTVKNIQILKKTFQIKNGMSSVIVSHLFLNKTEIITALRNKMTFFYLLYERYIMAVKAFLI